MTNAPSELRSFHNKLIPILHSWGIARDNATRLANVADLREGLRYFIQDHHTETAEPFHWTASENTIIAAIVRVKQRAAA